MILSYTLYSRTEDGRHINGNVLIDSTANITSSGRLVFSIVSFQVHCSGETFCGCGGDSDSIVFSEGPPDSDTVVTSTGLWSMGDWNNGGSGVWFRNVDGLRYESTEDELGKLDCYKYIGPRIELCADMVEQGPFQPIDNVWLTWDPQFHLKNKHGITSPAPPHGFGRR